MTGRFAMIGTALSFAVAGLVLNLDGPTATPDRSTPPELGVAPSLTLPTVQKRSLSNGLPVWVIETHEIPLVQVSLVVHTGSGDDPADGFGVASLTAAMLDEGAGSRSSLEIADAIEFLGADLSTSSSFDASAVRLNVPVARLDEALPVMADVALRPTFPAEELERLRQERLTALLQAHDDAASVAGLAFARAVFGPYHRYGTGTTGTEATLRAFNREYLRTFHRANYQPSNATLIVVGDVSAASLQPVLDTHFGGWRVMGNIARGGIAPADQLTSGGITIVDMPDAEQSQIRMGWVGVSRSTPDYFALQVLNTILGGSFTSRLNQNLREEHGYAYGASSRFEMRLSSGAFVAGAGVQTDKTAESLQEFLGELRGIREPVGPEELAKARNYLALGFPSDFETIRDLSSRLEELVVYGLPENYFSTYIERVQAVTVEDVYRAAQRYIQPDMFAIVVVGDRTKIEPSIRALDLGPVRAIGVREALP